MKRISECAGGERGSIDGDSLLFDLEVDPGERMDLSSVKTAPELADAATRVFTRPERIHSVEGKIDSGTRELLDQLGYR
jgi:hypothetical protein